MNWGSVKFPFFRLLLDECPLPITEYTTNIATTTGKQAGIPSFDDIYELYKSGASVVFQAMHLYDYAIALFCQSIQEDVGGSVQANAYLSPPGKNALPPHYDTHDVFIIQVFGSKRWRVWKSSRSLPLKSVKEPVRGVTKHGWPSIEGRAPMVDTKLCEGQTLYIPRGFTHVASASDRPSLHITIGINFTLVSDLLSRCLHMALEDFRSSADWNDRLSPREVGWIGNYSATTLRRFEHLTSKLIGRVNIANALEESRMVLAAERLALGGERLTAALKTREVGLNSVLSTSARAFTLRVNGDFVEVAFWGGTERFNRTDLFALQFALDGQPFSVGEIPQLASDDERIRLATRLMSMGLCDMLVGDDVK